MRYDSVVAVNPGLCEAQLQPVGGGPAISKAELVAIAHESYVVLRCGVESQVGKVYPQEVFVFPQSPKKALGAASRVAIASMWLAAVAFASFVGAMA